MRVVLDVNWLVSASINASSRSRFSKLLMNERVVFCVCAELLEECDHGHFSTIVPMWSASCRLTF